MLDSGQWWVPEYNAGEPHVAKPPLTYWSIDASMGVFGRNAWATRLPRALAFVFTRLLVIGLAQALGSMQPWGAGVLWAGMLVPERLAGRFVQVTTGCGLAARALGPPLRDWLPYEVLPGA